MEGLNLPDKQKKILAEFLEGLKKIYKENLISVILYGSAVAGGFSRIFSNLNLLVIMKDVSLSVLVKCDKLIRRYPGIQALFFTPEYIYSSLDTFPIEFLDIKDSYRVLYGEDILKDLNIDAKNLRFQCEHELKIKLVGLRHIYLKIHRSRHALAFALSSSFTSLLHILRNVLRIKGRQPPTKKEEILEELSSEFDIDLDIWGRLFKLKQGKLRLNRNELETLYIDFIRDLENLVEAIDKL